MKVNIYLVPNIRRIVFDLNVNNLSIHVNNSYLIEQIY